MGLADAAAQVDLDIQGPQNSVRQEVIELEAKAFPWAMPGANGPGANGSVVLQKRVRRTLPETEEDASIGFDAAVPTVISIINERSQNKWGTPQGYRIQARWNPAETL
jgi:Cu2+-containing amine oxidase